MIAFRHSQLIAYGVVDQLWRRYNNIFMLCLLGLCGLLLWYFQEKLLFYPNTPQGMETPEKNPPPYQNPAQMSISYEDVYIETVDGCKLHAWFMYQKNSEAVHTAPTLIFFQGNAGNMGLRMSNLQYLYRLCKVNILAVSYRGYGYSSGIPSEKGLYIDAQAALDYLLARKDIDHSKIIAFGRSVGGAIAIDLAYKRGNQLQAIIVENTFTSIREMALVVFPFLRFFPTIVALVQRLYMDSIAKVPTIIVPIMFISGSQDKLVPPDHVTRLYESAISSTLKHSLTVPNGTHNDTWQVLGATYFDEINRFIRDVDGAKVSTLASNVQEQLNVEKRGTNSLHLSEL